MPVQDRPISEFPRALEVLATALVLISNPSGVDTYDSNSCTLTELGKTILDIEYTQELGQMSVFEAILNVRVLSGTSDPTSAVGVDNQLYVKYQTVGGVDSVVAVYVKLDGDWVEIQTGGGGATVTLGTTVPLDASGSNGDLYVQYDGTTYAVIEYFVKINGSWRKAPYSRVVALTQAEYDLITPDPTTLYIITDAQSSYQTKTDANLDTKASTIVGAINELNEFNTMGAETPISTTAPFVEYRVCGHLLFVQINTWDHAITSDETLGYIPNTITVLMQGRQYTSTGLIAIDKTDGRIWARNLATYSAFLFVLPIA